MRCPFHQIPHFKVPRKFHYSTRAVSFLLQSFPSLESSFRKTTLMWWADLPHDANLFRGVSQDSTRTFLFAKSPKGESVLIFSKTRQLNDGFRSQLSDLQKSKKKRIFKPCDCIFYSIVPKTIPMSSSNLGLGCLAVVGESMIPKTFLPNISTAR